MNSQGLESLLSKRLPGMKRSKSSSKTMVIEVDSPDMTAFEEVMESLTGDDANPFIQLLIISLLIAGLVIFIKRGQRRRIRFGMLMTYLQ